MLLVAAIHLEQHLLRRRAERLLAEVRSLELRKTSRAEAQQVFAHWGRSIERGEDCSDAKCSLEIRLADAAYYWPWFNLLGYERLHRLYLFVGGRSGDVKARVESRNGIVWGKSFSIIVAAPPHDDWFAGHPYGLKVAAETFSRFFPNRASLMLHPDYAVGTAFVHRLSRAIGEFLSVRGSF